MVSKIFGSHRHQLGLMAVAAGLVCNAAWAQSSAGAPPNIGTVLQTVPPVMLQRAEDQPAVDAAGMAAKRNVPAGGPKVLVKGFTLQGNTSLPTDVLMVGLKPYENRELTIEEIGEAADTVRDRYRNAGLFLAQAFVPSQEIANGVVQIRILEGSIGKVTAKLAPGLRVTESQVNGYLSLLPPGSTVTEQSVERPLLLLSDLPATKVHSVLKPGAAIGSADLEVEVSPDGRLFTGSVYLDNYGEVNTGDVRLGADIESRGLLGVGEVLSASFFKARNLTTVGRIGATFPVGRLGTKLSFGVTDLAYNVGGAYESLKAKGDGLVTSALVQHPLIRSRNINVLLLGGLDLKRVNDIPSAGSLGLERKITTVRLGVGGDFRDDLAGGALNSYSVALVSGNNKFTSSTNLTNDQSASGDKTAGSFSKLQFEYLRLQSLASLLTEFDSLYLSLRGQISLSQNLDGTEKVALGGPRGVRAYPVGALSGDDVTVATVEIRHRLGGFRPLGGNIILSGFVDGGHAKLYHSPGTLHSVGNTRTLGAAGVGASFVKKDDFELRLDVARQIGPRDFQGADNKQTRAWALLQKWF